MPYVYSCVFGGGGVTFKTILFLNILKDEQYKIIRLSKISRAIDKILVSIFKEMI